MNTISFALNFFWGHFIFFFDTESTLTRSDELLVVTEFYNIAGNDFDEKKNLPIVDNRHVFVVTKLVVSETQCIFWQLFWNLYPVACGCGWRYSLKEQNK